MAPEHNASQILKQLNTPLWIVTSQYQGTRGGLAATFVSAASIVPDHPRVIVGIAKQHSTHRLITESGSLALHLLTTDQSELAVRFGLNSSRDLDKFNRLKTRTAVTESPILVDVPCWLDCVVEESMDTGDRTVFLLKIVDSGVALTGTQLTVHDWVPMLNAEQQTRLAENMAADIQVDRHRIATWITHRSISHHA